jgi:hypothetical protein
MKPCWEISENQQPHKSLPITHGPPTSLGILFISPGGSWVCLTKRLKGLAVIEMFGFTVRQGVRPVKEYSTE